MNSLNTIMLVMSPQRRVTPALRRAVAYARHADAVVHLCLFDFYGPIDYSKIVFGAEVADRARRDFLDERLLWLSEQAAGLADQGIRVECDAIWAPDPSKAVIGKMLQLQPDLVLKDVECASGRGSEIRPSGQDWKLLRLSPSPLMLVHPASHLLPRHLLAAVDVTMAGEEGDLNDRILQTAQDYAGLSHADLDLVSSFSYMPIDLYGSGFIANTYEIMDAAHQEALHRFAARHHMASNHVKRRCAFDTAQEIAACALDSKADLVVMGSAYHSGFDRLAFGATAESLLGKLACDVLLVKPARFVDELAKHVKGVQSQPELSAIA